MKLGLVTYQIARNWDVSKIIKICKKIGFQGVELRTTHAHGVEISLDPQQRQKIKNQFNEANIEIAGLGSTFEFHAIEPEIVRENISGTIEYAKLAADLDCPGIKVRPNGLQKNKGIPVEKTLEQIGHSLRKCAKGAADLGIQIRIEVHGRETSNPKHMRSIIDHADHPNATLCWNSNPGEVINGSVKNCFDLLKDKLGLVHINELHNTDYPWQEFFGLLKASNYTGYTLAEIPESSEPERLLRYYKSLWEAYTQ